MVYHFQSGQRHNFLSILKRKIINLLWPVAVFIALQLLFPQSELVKLHYHFYFLLIIEVLQVFSITRDSINAIIINTDKELLQVNYYNFLEGQVERAYAFSTVKVDIRETWKKEVREIVFSIKKKADFTLEKRKDFFSQQDLESLKEVLYNITSPKTAA